MKLIQVNAYSKGRGRVRAHTRMGGGPKVGGAWKPKLKGQHPNSDRGGIRGPIRAAPKSILAPVGTPWKPMASQRPNLQEQTPMRRRSGSGSVARPNPRRRKVTTGSR